MNKDFQRKKTGSVLEEGADKTLRLSLEFPHPDVATPEDVIRYRTKVGQAWIEEDIRRGVLPSSVKEFAALHEYVDANMYLIDEDLKGSKIGSFYEWDWDVQTICDHFNQVCEALDNWLGKGRTRDAASFLESKRI